MDAFKSDSLQPVIKVTNDDNKDNINQAELPCRNPARIYHLSTRFQNVANLSVFPNNDDISKPLFTKSQRKEINGLLEKRAFEVVTISDVTSGIRIFNSRFVDKIKNERTVTAFEILKLVVQAYNNHGKEQIFPQSPTI